MMLLITGRIKNAISLDSSYMKYSIRKIITNIISTLIFAFIALPVTAHQYQVGDIEIIDPWTRETPKGIKTSSGYLYIINHSSTPDRLIAISANDVEITEIHSMTVANNIMKMEKMHNGVEIPGNGEATLKPGGNHIMFMGILKPFKKGDKISAKLTFEKAGTIDVYFEVGALGATSPPKSLLYQ
ncbi:copper chaperone PCu(A)C [Bartonella sp. B30(2025)]